MKFNFFEKAKTIGAAAAITAAGAQEASAIETPTKDSHINKTEISVQENKKTDEKAFVFGGKEINESNEKIFNLELTKEALLNIDKGAFLSKQMPGFILIAEESTPDHGGSYFNHSILMKAYKVPTGDELMSGYHVFNISLNAEEGSSNKDILNELNKNGVNSDFKVSSRLNPTNPLDISYLFNKLSEKIGPLQAQSLLEQVNPSIDRKTIIASLVENLNQGNGTKEDMLKDIEILKQTPQSTAGENLAETVINE